MSLTIQDLFRAYAGHAAITGEMLVAADVLLGKVNPFLEACILKGWEPRVNPSTGTLVSGVRDGGWRPPECPIGAAGSAHKQGRAVDIADADGSLDALITDEMLEEHGLYREHPDATATWCHLTDRSPKSGNRSFYP